MPLTKLQFRPGINREGTNYSNEGGWFDGNFIRFRYGYVERIGGWEKVNSTTFLGTARELHDFVTLSSQNLLFVGTHIKAYIEESGTFRDITPFRRTVLLPQAVTGSAATGGVGSVAIFTGAVATQNVAVTGEEATGVAGLVGSIIVETTHHVLVTGEEATGQVGDLEPAEHRLIISEVTEQITSDLGTVTVKTLPSGGDPTADEGFFPLGLEATGAAGYVTVGVG